VGMRKPGNEVKCDEYWIQSPGRWHRGEFSDRKIKRFHVLRERAKKLSNPKSQKERVISGAARSTFHNSDRQ